MYISEEDATENTKHLDAPKQLEILINKFLSFSVLRHAATGKFSGEQIFVCKTSNFRGATISR